MNYSENTESEKYGDIIRVERRPNISSNKVIKLIDEDIEKVLKQRLHNAYKNIKQKPVKHNISNSKACLNLYSRYPWIKDYKYTLISTTNKKYINKDIPSEKWNKYTLYKPNMLFNILNCNYNKSKRKQVKNVYTVYDEKNSPVNFTVVHVLKNDKRIIQNEEIFNDELKWLKFNKLERYHELELLLSQDMHTNSKLDNIIRKITTSTLKQYIQISNEEYIESITNSIYEFVDNLFTVRDYLRILANIVVYIHPIFFKQYAIIFNNKLVSQIYNPTVIFTLSDAKKFPEAFHNLAVSQTSLAFIKDMLDHSKASIVSMLAKELYFIMNPTERRWSSSRIDTFSLQIPELISNPCKNNNNLPEWEIIRYSENKSEYCLSITELIDQFSKKDYINKHSGKKFYKSFIDQFITTYKKSDINIPVSLTESEISENQLIVSEDTPDVIQLLKDTIIKLEDQLLSLSESKLNKLCEYCTEFISRKDGISSINTKGEIINLCDVKCLSKLNE